MRESINGNSIVIGTSLAPFDFEKQIRAVQSWVENGFYVIACNSREEIEILKDPFSTIPVEFIEIESKSKKNGGKKLPYVQDILDIVSQRAEKVCGFINSDIIFSQMPIGMNEFIIDEALNSIIIIHRNEIDEYSDIQSLNWIPHFGGIDVFFVDKKITWNLFDDGFYVQSMWDLGILMKCKLAGIKIKEMINPVAFHKKHLINWNFDISNIVEKFMKTYYGITKNGYREAKKQYYKILFEDCKRICFCSAQEKCCLFKVDKNNDMAIKSIDYQDYDNKVIQYLEGDNEESDIIVYVPDGVIFDSVFCKAIVYIMEQFECDFLEIGRFFVSDINGEKFFSELNRNINLIEKINRDCNIITKVVKGKGLIKRKLYLPISYEVIDIYDLNKVDIIRPHGLAYITPAGVWAKEWCYMYGNDMDIDIIGYIDNNKEKVGKKLGDKQIYSIECLEKDGNEPFVIIASKYYGLEIERQLLNIIKTNKVLNISYVLEIEANKDVYYFNLEKYKRYYCRRRIV